MDVEWQPVIGWLENWHKSMQVVYFSMKENIDNMSKSPLQITILQSLTIKIYRYVEQIYNSTIKLVQWSKN